MSDENFQVPPMVPFPSREAAMALGFGDVLPLRAPAPHEMIGLEPIKEAAAEVSAVEPVTPSALQPILDKVRADAAMAPESKMIEQMRDMLKQVGERHINVNPDMDIVARVSEAQLWLSVALKMDAVIKGLRNIEQHRKSPGLFAS